MVVIVLQRGDEVYNVPRTSHCHSRRFPSWKKFWENQSYKKWPYKCRIANCRKIAIDGAHVWIKGLEGQFILPTCNHCNTKKLNQWLTANSRAIVVPVTASDTRGHTGCH